MCGGGGGGGGGFVSIFTRMYIQHCDLTTITCYVGTLLRFWSTIGDLTHTGRNLSIYAVHAKFVPSLSLHKTEIRSFSLHHFCAWRAWK